MYFQISLCLSLSLIIKNIVLNLMLPNAAFLMDCFGSAVQQCSSRTVAHTVVFGAGKSY